MRSHHWNKRAWHIPKLYLRGAYRFAYHEIDRLIARLVSVVPARSKAALQGGCKRPISPAAAIRSSDWNDKSGNWQKITGTRGSLCPQHHRRRPPRRLRSPFLRTALRHPRSLAHRPHRGRRCPPPDNCRPQARPGIPLQPHGLPTSRTRRSRRVVPPTARRTQDRSQSPAARHRPKRCQFAPTVNVAATPMKAGLSAVPDTMRTLATISL